MDRCAKCGAELGEGALPTPLGERVCPPCHDTAEGAALGLVSGGGLGGAMAGPGILRWVRERLSPDLRREREARERAQPRSGERGAPGEPTEPRDRGPGGGSA